jgi:hypothetical protein
MPESRTQARLPAALDERLTKASEERGLFRSELTRRALRYYMAMNPDEFDAFSGVSAPSLRGIDPANTADTGRDRASVETVEVQDEDLREEQSGEWPGEDGVYDPTEEP